MPESTSDSQPPDLPPSLAARPRDARRGLPIPPVNLFADTTTAELRVDFTTVNTATSAAYAAARRCSLCGQPMGYWVAFLGSPRAAELRQYADPPGCVACMEAAVRLCPYIAIRHHRRARSDRPGAGIFVPGADRSKPPVWVLGITRRYGIAAVVRDGYALYRPAPFRTTQTFGYGPDGHIDPTPTTRHG